MKLTEDKMVWIPDDEDWHKWSGDYEKEEFSEVMEYISNKGTALDIGAHVGIWTKRLAEEFEHTYCFEPVPKHVECWHKNVANDFTNVDIAEVALSDVEGTAIMKVPNTTNTGMASLELEKKDGRWLQEGWEDFPEIEVKTRPLDSYEFDELDFMKIDVEWHEFSVLQGALETIQKHKPDVYIEIHDYQAYAFFLSMGYRCFFANSMNRLFKFVPICNTVDGDTKVQNRHFLNKA